MPADEPSNDEDLLNIRLNKVFRDIESFIEMEVKSTKQIANAEYEKLKVDKLRDKIAGFFENEDPDAVSDKFNSALDALNQTLIDADNDMPSLLQKLSERLNEDLSNEEIADAPEVNALKMGLSDNLHKLADNVSTNSPPNDEPMLVRFNKVVYDVQKFTDWEINLTKKMALDEYEKLNVAKLGEKIGDIFENENPDAFDKKVDSALDALKQTLSTAKKNMPSFLQKVEGGINQDISDEEKKLQPDMDALQATVANGIDTVAESIQTR